MLLIKYVLICVISFQIGRNIAILIDYLTAKNYVTKDLSFLSEKEIKTLLKPEFFWNYQMLQKMMLLLEKNKSLTDYFLDEVDVKKVFPENDANKILALLFLLNKHTLDNAKRLKNISKSIFKTLYYNRKYSFNDRVIKICDPRQIYNIQSILSAIKDKIERNEIVPISDDFIKSNIIYHAKKLTDMV